MAKKKQKLENVPVQKALGTMTHSMTPSDYANKYVLDGETGAMIPRSSNQPHDTMPALATKQVEGGMLEVYIPQLALGSHLNMWDHGQQPTQDFFSVEKYPRHRTDGKADIEKAVYWWRHDPVLFKCIRFLCQLANSRVKFSSDDESAKETVEFWFKQAMPDSFRRGWFLEYFRSGFVPTIKTLVPYVPREYKSGKIPQTDEDGNVDDSSVNEVERVKAVAAHTAAVVKSHQAALDEYKKAVAQAEQARMMHAQRLCSDERLAKYEQAVALKQYEWLKGNIAGAYTVLDPMSVDIEGPAEMQWMREPFLNVGHELQAAVLNPTPLQAAMITRLPTEVVTQIRNGANKVWLSPNICNITFGDKQDYERYPTPIAKHCFHALEMKAEMYAMQRATVQSLKNRILLIKVGSDQFPVTDPKTMDKVSAIFNGMGRTGHFVWSHAIEMEWIEPENQVLSDEKIYSHWNNEIRSVTGVNPIFTGTSEGSSSIGNSIMNFKGVEEEVGEAQNAFIELLEKEIKLLRTALSISADVQVSFDKMNLKDENQFIAVIMQMVMNGLLDPETALEQLGYHFPEISKRFDKILKERQKGKFLPVPTSVPVGPDGKPVPQGHEKVDPKTGKAIPGTIDVKRQEKEAKLKAQQAQQGKTPGGAQSKPGGKGGTTTGGRPKNQTGAKNQQKKGKSQPKKSITLTLKAVGSGEDQTVYGIVSEPLEGEELDQACAVFNVEPDQLVTAEEFAEMFPEEDLINAWPELSTFEVMQASAAAIKMIKDIEVVGESYINEWRRQKSEPGKRGPYVTAEVKAEASQWSSNKVFKEYFKSQTGLEDVPDELKEAWDKHLLASKSLVEGQVQGMADEHLNAQAVAMATARFKKTMD